MGKARRNGSRATKRRSSATKNSRAVDLKLVRQRIINLVGNKACDMVKTTTEEFKKTGNITTLKYLFEMIGLFPCPPGEQQNAGEDSLTVTLLQRLGLPEESETESGITNDTGGTCLAVAADAVE